MDPGRTTDPLTHSVLDHEIEKTLSVDPSPEFLARVRLCVANEPMHAAWGFTWKLAGAGIGVTAIVVVAVGVLWQGPQSPPTAPKAELRSLPLPDSPLGTPVLSRPSNGAPARSRFVQRRVEPEVLISPEESAALRQLFTDISRGRVEPASLPDVEPASPLMSIMEIAIEPIAVDPLTPLGSE